MSDPLQIGVIGAGHFGRFHALKIAASARARLAGVTDRDAARAGVVGAEAGGAPAIPLDALFACCGAVIFAAPAEAHYELAAQAMRAGCHVLVEKPLAATLEQADSLATLAAQTGRVLQVGHLLRYSAEHRAISSRIARPLYIEATRIAPFKPRGTDVSVILDLMIHDLDLVLRWWTAISCMSMRSEPQFRARSRISPMRACGLPMGAWRRLRRAAFRSRPSAGCGCLRGRVLFSRLRCAQIDDDWARTWYSGAGNRGLSAR